MACALRGRVSFWTTAALIALVGELPQAGASAQVCPYNMVEFYCSPSAYPPFCSPRLYSDLVVDSGPGPRYVYRDAVYEQQLLDTLTLGLMDVYMPLRMRSIRISRAGEDIFRLSSWPKADTGLWTIPPMNCDFQFLLRDSMGIVGDSAWEAAGLGDTVYPLFCRVVANLTRALSLTGTPSPGNLDTAVMIMAGDSIEIVTASTPHEWCVTHINASAHGVAPRAQDDADGVLHNLLGRTVGRNADGTLGVFVSVDAMRSARYVLIATAKRVCLAVRH